MSSAEVVVIAGAPGSGKSTLMAAIAAHLPGWPPRIEFSDLREWHLDPMWTRQSRAEEALAFDNLVYVIENYRRHGFTPVLVTDLREHRVRDLVDRLGNVAVISLVANDEVIRERVSARADGFTDVSAASEWNERVRASAVLPCEKRFDTSDCSVMELAHRINSELFSGGA